MKRTKGLHWFAWKISTKRVNNIFPHGERFEANHNVHQIRKYANDHLPRKTYTFSATSLAIVWRKPWLSTQLVFFILAQPYRHHTNRCTCVCVCVHDHCIETLHLYVVFPPCCLFHFFPGQQLKKNTSEPPTRPTNNDEMETIKVERNLRNCHDIPLSGIGLLLLGEFGEFPAFGIWDR